MGLGPTVRVILNVSPTHPLPEVGVMVYTTVALEELEFIIVPVTFPVPCALSETPEMVPVIAVICQLNVLTTEFPPVALMLS
jgi:hypothetical protein